MKVSVGQIPIFWSSLSPSAWKTRHLHWDWNPFQGVQSRAAHIDRFVVNIYIHLQLFWCQRLMPNNSKFSDSSFLNVNILHSFSYKLNIFELWTFWHFIDKQTNQLIRRWSTDWSTIATIVSCSPTYDYHRLLHRDIYILMFVTVSKSSPCLATASSFSADSRDAERAGSRHKCFSQIDTQLNI